MGKILAAIIILAILIFSVLLLFTLMPAEEKPPEKMGIANFLEESDRFEVYFTLEDSDGDQVRADGNVTVVIKDSLATLYTDTFTIEKSDFGQYETPFGLELLAYKWDIPFSDVNKSFAGEPSLDGIITFVYEGKEMSSGEEYVSLPDALKATLYETFNLTVNEHGRVPPLVISYGGYVYVNVTMTNICPFQQDLWQTVWEVETSDGLVFGWGGDDPDLPDKLDSGASFTWVIYFDVPDGKTPIRIIYYDELEVPLQ
ncbi:MAG: hypothetical protein ACE5QF_09580 [Thermoplasmata archaeon]